MDNSAKFDGDIINFDDYMSKAHYMVNPLMGGYGDDCVEF